MVIPVRLIARFTKNGSIEAIQGRFLPRMIGRSMLKGGALCRLDGTKTAEIRAVAGDATND
jgi:hypothetical protein